MNVAPLVRRFLAPADEDAGQALAEYSLILALVLVGVVGTLALLGIAVANPFTTFVEAAGLDGG